MLAVQNVEVAVADWHGRDHFRGGGSGADEQQHLAGGVVNAQIKLVGTFSMAAQSDGTGGEEYGAEVGWVAADSFQRSVTGKIDEVQRRLARTGGGRGAREMSALDHRDVRGMEDEVGVGHLPEAGRFRRGSAAGIDGPSKHEIGYLIRGAGHSPAGQPEPVGVTGRWHRDIN